MGVSVQTRFDTTLNGAITDTDTTAILDAAPAFTTGYGTFERGEANEEDVYWGGVSGLQLTALLRGLSQTALTNTEIAGNKKAHVDGVQFEGTLLHYIINDKASKSSNEAVTGAWTFNTQLPTSTDTPGANAELTTKVYVDTADALKGNLSGGNTWGGVQIFADDSARSTTNAAPSDQKSFANKKYVDDQIALTGNNKVSISSNETASGFLEDQIEDDPNAYIAWSTQNDGGDETLRGTVNAAQSSSGTASANKLVAGDAEGRIDETWRGVEMTAGETITVSGDPIPVCLAGASMKFDITLHDDSAADSDWSFNASSTPGTYNIGDTDATARRAQSFTVSGGGANTITVESIALLLKKTGTPTDNFIVDIQTDDGSNKPDNVTITNGSSDNLAGGDMATTYALHQIEWSTPPTLTSGQKYWFVFKRSSALDGSNYFQVAHSNANDYANHGNSSYTGSTLTWTSENTTDIMLHARFNLDFGGKIFKLDTDDPLKSDFIGFVKTTVNDDAEALVIPPSEVIDDFSGLTVGKNYYGSTTAGNTTATPTTTKANALIPLGKALSATKMLTFSLLKTYWREINTIELTAGATSVSIDFLVTTGFRPDKIRLQWRKDEDATEVDGETFEQTWVGTSNSGGISATAMDGEQICITTSTKIQPAQRTSGNGLFVNAVYDNGFEMRATADSTQNVFRSICIYAEGR